MVDMNQFMKQAQAMQQKMMEAQEKMANAEFVGKSGGGSVEITINGKGDLNKVKIDPELANKDEVEIIEDLVVAAFHDAKQKLDEESQNSMSGMMGGMKLPPGFKMPF